MLLYGLIVAICSAGIVVGGMLALRHTMASSAGSPRGKVLSRIQEAEGEIKALLHYSDAFVSKGQFEAVSRTLEQLTAELEAEKHALKEIESKLNKAQDNVENKEGQQQALKTAREEDEQRLEELMSTFSTISEESRQLERRLADSLKELDRMLEELELTADQRDVLDELSKALTAAGGLLRDLITEHAALYERLDQLRQQHRDLEDEYTKLVEQQLGE